MEKVLYPVIILSSANGKVFESLAGANYLLAKNLLGHDLKEIKKRTDLDNTVLRNLIKEAGMICYCQC